MLLFFVRCMKFILQKYIITQIVATLLYAKNTFWQTKCKGQNKWATFGEEIGGWQSTGRVANTAIFLWNNQHPPKEANDKQWEDHHNTDICRRACFFLSDWPNRSMLASWDCHFGRSEHYLCQGSQIPGVIYIKETLPSNGSVKHHLQVECKTPPSDGL